MNSDTLKIKAKNLQTAIKGTDNPTHIITTFLVAYYQETIEEVAQEMLAKSNKCAREEDARLASFYNNQASEVRAMKGRVLR